MRTVICLTVFLLLGCQSSKVPLQGTARATIERVSGQPEVRRSGGSWEPAQIGQSLRQGDEARTPGASEIDFNLGEYAGVLSLTPGSTLRFEQLGAITAADSVHAVIDLPQGRIIGDTLKLPGRTKVIVKTPRGSVEIP